MAITQLKSDEVLQSHSVARRASSWAEILFVLPIILVVGLLLLTPTVVVILHSFTNWQPGGASPWVGLKNFTDLARSDSFQQILKNQAVLLLGIPILTVIPLIIAVLLYDGVPAAGVFRTIFFFPATVAPAIMGILFSFLLAPSGPFNTTLKFLLPDSLARNWLVDPKFVMPTLIVVLAWATTGIGVVIFSAGLSTVPPDIFEAALLDGASWWQRFWHVVLPSLRHVIGFWVVILVITVFLGMFAWVFTLTRGGPGYSSTTLDFDIYQNALSFGFFGTAAAETVYLLVIVALIVIIGGGAIRRGRPGR